MSSKLLALLVVALVTVGAISMSPAGAAPDQVPACDGRRETSTEIADHFPVANVGEAEFTGVKFILRYSPDTLCLWGLVDNVAPALHGIIWVEYSEDGGVTWLEAPNSRVATFGLFGSRTHTGAYRDAPGRLIRACGYMMAEDIATYIREPRESVPYVSPTVCTQAW